MARGLNPIVLRVTGFSMLPSQPHSFSNILDDFQDVHELYLQFIGNPAGYTGWEKAFDAYMRCAYCYGNFEQWARLQTATLPLTEKAFEFVLDCIRFISTGQRQFQLSTWRILLASPPDLQVSDKVRGRRMQMLNDALELMPSDPIPMWCTHEGGLKDLIVSSAIMFADLSRQPHP